MGSVDGRRSLRPAGRCSPASWRRTVQAVLLQARRDVVVVDAGRGQLAEHLPGVLVVAAHRVGGHLAVVGDGAQGGLGHGVDHAGRDQVGHVPGVGVGRILDRGRGPQRPLRPGARPPPARPTAARRASARSAGRPASRWRSRPGRAARPPRRCRSCPAARRPRCRPGRRRTRPPIAIGARSWPACRARSRPSRKASITSSYRAREKIRVTLMLMPSARQAAMAGSPCRAAGILMNKLGRSTRHHSARASAMVASVSWASRGSTSIDARPSTPSRAAQPRAPRPRREREDGWPGSRRSAWSAAPPMATQQ